MMPARKWLIVIGVLLAAVLVLGLTLSSCDDGPSSFATADEVEEACGEDPYGCVEYGPDGTIGIGALLWLNATADPTGIDSRRGVELAIDYLGGEFDGVPGTVLGHEVRIEAVDDGCDQQQGTRGAEALVETEGLLAVVGTTCSSSAINAAAEVLSEEGITLISPTNTAPELTDPVLREEFYARTAPNDLIQGTVVGNFGVRIAKGAGAVAITDRTAYSDSLVEAFTSAFPKRKVKRVVVRADDTADSIQAKFEEATSTGDDPGIVYFPLIGDTCPATVEAMAASTEAALLTSDGCLNGEVLGVAEANGVELYASGPDVRDLESNPFYGSEFLPAYRDQYGENPTSIFHAHAFDAANLIFDAFRRTALIEEDGSIAVPRTAFRDAVLSVTAYDGFSGRLTCTDSGDCQEGSLISIYRSPAWPIEGGTANPKPVYAQSETLSSLTEGED